MTTAPRNKGTAEFHLETRALSASSTALNRPSPWDDAAWQPELRFLSPGRVNLIGEHMDNNGGMSLPFAIDRGISFALESATRENTRKPDPAAAAHGLVQLAVEHGTQGDYAILRSSQHAFPSPTPHALRYLVGAWKIAQDTWPDKEPSERKSYRIRITSTLPPGSGLSSSAAYSLGLLLCFGHMRGVGPQPASVWARLAQRVEHEYAGTPCGLMDQIAILNTPEAGYLELDFSAPLRVTEHIPPSYPEIRPHSFAALGSRWQVVLFQSGRKHTLSDGSYETRRKECEAAAALLSRDPSMGHALKGSSHASSPLSLGELWNLVSSSSTSDRRAATLQTMLQPLSHPTQRSRTRFVFEELERTRGAIRAIAQGNMSELGHLLDAAQDGLRQDYEVSCAEIDHAVALLRQFKKTTGTLDVLGPRMMGGGWGGSLILLVAKDKVTQLQSEWEPLLKRYQADTGCLPELIVTEPHHGLRHEPALAGLFCERE